MYQRTHEWATIFELCTELHCLRRPQCTFTDHPPVTLAGSGPNQTPEEGTESGASGLRMKAPPSRSSIALDQLEEAQAQKVIGE